MQHGFLQDGDGHKSMGRLLALMAQVVGAVVVLAGLGVFVAAFLARYTEALGNAVALTGLGVGIEGAALAAKNWAKHEERQ